MRASTEPGSKSLDRGRRLRALVPFAVPVLVFIALSLGGITTSSIGVDILRQNPAQPHGTAWGDPQPVRADEYLTESPIGLGWIATGGVGIDNPLSVPPDFFHQLPSGPVSTVVFFDGTAARLGPWLPDAMIFAARWWLPTLLLFLGLPAWFRQLTGSRRWGYLAAVLVTFAPAAAWWSGRPINTIGFVAAASALLLWAHLLWTQRDPAGGRQRRGRRAKAGVAMVLSAVLLARFPSYYQPFAIILGFPVLLATVLVVLRRPSELRPKLLVLGVTGGLGAALTAGTMLENLEAIRSGLGTVFPGQRVSTGTALPWGRVFGAPHLGFLDQLQPSLVSTSNATEISSAFAVLFPVTVLAWAAQRLRTRRSWRGTAEAQPAFWVFLGASALWLVWCTVNLGAFGARFPLLNLVPAYRAANAVGFLAVIALCLFLSQVPRPGPMTWVRPTVAVLGALLAGGLTVLGGVSLRAEAPTLEPWMIAVSTTGSAVVVGLLLLWPHRLVPLLATGIAAALLTITVNPIEFGLADLRSSETARAMMENGNEARSEHTLWASDTPQFDALMFATGVPALSSRQQVGPQDEEWVKLDPGGEHREVWNRGGSYIRFVWSSSPAITWSNPTVDQIVMTASPCAVAARQPRLRHIVSSYPLKDSCLAPKPRLRWSGNRQFVYEVRR